MIIKPGVIITVHTGKQPACAKQKSCVGTEIVEFPFVIAEIGIHLIEKAGIVSRADLQIRINIMLAPHGRDFAGINNLIKPAHVVELIHQGRIQLLLAV